MRQIRWNRKRRKAHGKRMAWRRASHSLKMHPHHRLFFWEPAGGRVFFAKALDLWIEAGAPVAPRDPDSPWPKSPESAGKGKS